MEELEEGVKALKGKGTPQDEQQIQLRRTSESSQKLSLHMGFRTTGMKPECGIHSPTGLPCPTSVGEDVPNLAETRCTWVGENLEEAPSQRRRVGVWVSQ